jgi:hypothetical protein
MTAMFTIPTLQKLIVLVIVLVAVWKGFQLLQRLGRARNAASAPPRQAPAARRDSTAVQETRQCAACGAYVSAGAGKCGRADCPV